MRNGPKDGKPWQEMWGDNFSFLTHELFLSALAILLRRAQFSEALELLTSTFSIPHPDYSRQHRTGNYTILYDYSEVLADRNKRLQERKINPQGMLLTARANTNFVPKEWRQQADLICVLRLLLVEPTSDMWWPHTLLYTHYLKVEFELFRKARSRKFYDMLAPFWGNRSPDVFRKELAASIESGRGSKLHADHSRPQWAAWLNWDLATSD